MTELNYGLFALRYATRHARRGDHFIGGDPFSSAREMRTDGKTAFLQRPDDRVSPPQLNNVSYPTCKGPTVF
jgi:hypothetical protein